MKRFFFTLCLSCLLLYTFVFGVQGRIGLAPHRVAIERIKGGTEMPQSNVKAISSHSRDVTTRIARLRGGVERFQPKKVLISFSFL